MLLDTCVVTHVPIIAPETSRAAHSSKAHGSGFAVTALIFGIISFVIAWLPVFGMIVGSVGVIFALIAMNKSHGSVRIAIWGLILGALGAIASLTVAVLLVVGLYIFTTSGWSSSGPEMPIMEVSSTEAPAPEYDPDSSPDDDALPGIGTPDQPAPMDTVIVAKEWTVVINSYNVDGNAVVNDVNPHRAPDPGTHFEVVNYTVTFTGLGSASTGDVGIEMMTDSFTTIAPTSGFLEDEMGDDVVSYGEKRTGSKTFRVPDSEHIVIRVTPNHFAYESFLSTD